MNTEENYYTQHLINSIGVWIMALESYPDWKSWNRQKIEMTVYSEIYSSDLKIGLKDFSFSNEIDLQHAVIIQFLGLQQTLEALKDCEFYFRRYPFNGLPISHSDHIRNICEMYFSRFYEFRERLKKYLNSLNKVSSGLKVDVGNLIKQFDNYFEQEIKARNSIHHHQRFDDLSLNKLHIYHTLSSGSMNKNHKAWEYEHRSQYRSTTKEWVARVRLSSTKVASFLEASAKITFEICPFLERSFHD